MRCLTETLQRQLFVGHIRFIIECRCNIYITQYIRPPGRTRQDVMLECLLSTPYNHLQHTCLQTRRATRTHTHTYGHTDTHSRLSRKIKLSSTQAPPLNNSLRLLKIQIRTCSLSVHNKSLITPSTMALTLHSTQFVLEHRAALPLVDPVCVCVCVLRGVTVKESHHRLISP